jgi:hypothetical protein
MGAKRIGGGDWACDYACARRKAAAVTAGRLGLGAATRAGAAVRWGWAAGCDLWMTVLRATSADRGRGWWHAA